MPIHQHESQGTVMDLVHHWFASVLLGRNPFDIQGIVRDLDRLVGRNWIAKTGIDHALCDIKGKALGIPSTSCWEAVAERRQNWVGYCRL